MLFGSVGGIALTFLLIVSFSPAHDVIRIAFHSAKVMDVEEALDWGDGELDQELQFGMEAHVQVEEAGEIETETEMGEIKAEVDQASELPQITTEPQSQSQGDKLDILQEQGNQAEAIPIPSASPISIRRQPSRSISISPSPSFYSSASSNLSTSDNPISSEEAKEGLPQGWTAIQDKECQLYYFHPVSGKTTRKRPKQELERDRIWALRNFGSKEQKEAERRSRFGGKRSATYNLGQEDKGATSKLSRNDYPMMDFNSSLSSENRRDFPNSEHHFPRFQLKGSSLLLFRGFLYCGKRG